MNKKLKDFSYAFGANILNFSMGILTGFLIPKFLGIEDYAYIKLFGFYAGYVGMSHFGFLDGIYIKYGAYDYEDLPKERFRGYFRFLLLIQLVVSLIASIGILIFTNDLNRSIVMYYVVINMILNNLSTMFAFVHQFTKRFKLFSINTVLATLIYVVGCLGLFASHRYGYKDYIILQVFANVVILILYIVYNKELVIGKSESLITNLAKYFGMIRSGIFVMLGNLMTIIILGIDRFFVDKLFTLKDFAMYSFAYSLVSLFYILLKSLTMVLYPYLTRAKEESYKSVYETIRISISILMSFTLMGYFIIKVIVIKFIPQYIDSFTILVFLVPTVIPSAQISILIANYYKVMKETKEYTKNNIIALIIGISANFIGYFIGKNVISIAIATLVAFIIWVIYSDMYFRKKLGINVLKAQIFDFVIVVLFLICALMFNWYVGLIAYFTFFVIIVCLKYKGELKGIIKMVKSK